MVKKETLLHYAKDDEDRILLSRIYDNYVRSFEKNYNTYSDFVSEEKKEVLENIFKNENSVEFCVYGGYEGAERVISAFLVNEETKNFPVSVLEIKGKGCESLSHRDILGSLMGLGIKRDTIGDILTGERCLIFVKSEISDYIILNLVKAGRYTISCDYYQGEEIIKEEKSEIINTTVSSNRLDVILAAGFKIKRPDAVKYINQGRVTVSGKMNVSSDLRLKENDRISLRGYGKIIFLGENGTSKKGRTVINIKKLL